MVKKHRSRTFLFFLTMVIVGACSSGSEEPSQNRKPTEFPAEVGEKALYEETNEGASPQYQSNTPPKITSAKVLPDPAYVNTDLRVEVEAEDTDDDFITYTYQWVKVRQDETLEQQIELEEGNESTLSRDNFVRGDAVAAKVIPSDGLSEGAMYLTKYVLVENCPPEIVSTPPETASQETVYAYQVKAIDPDGDPITFSLGEGAPEGMTIDSATGLITWPAKFWTGKTCKITIHADDGHQGFCSQHIVHTSRRTISAR